MWARPSLLYCLLFVAWSLACARPPSGHLELVIVEAGSGEITPARVEVLGPAGQAYVAQEALRVAGDCGWLPLHNWIEWAARWQMRRALRAQVPNPYTGTTQFYLDRPTRMRLPPGDYSIRVFKGMEHKVATRHITVQEDRAAVVRVELQRWIDLPAANWYGADDHLHIPRPSPAFDQRIARWMEAEDLHVANLLQMGLARSIHITPQYGFGEGSVRQSDQTLLASGQENPRTHVLGHSIILGSPRWIDFPQSYLAYDRFWRTAQELGAINGFAHWGLGGADEGLAAWVPEHLLHFLEVLGFGLPYYDTWYDLLNLGIRMTPTAGTDYPCSPSLPGRERFYTRLAGPLTYEAWIDAVRAGRTFITNGPALDLRVGGIGVGDELELEEPGTVTVEGLVRFDPERDDVENLQLIGAGEVLSSTSERTRPGEIRFSRKLPVEVSTWLALRANGEKSGETPVDFIDGLKSALTYLPRASNEEVLERLPGNGDPRPSAAHTAPIWVTVAGTPPITEHPQARQAARAWLARLNELEARLEEDRLEELAGFPGRGDGVELEDLTAGRQALLKAIARARAAYNDWPHSSPR